MVNDRIKFLVIFALLSLGGLFVAVQSVSANHGNVQVSGYPWSCERAGTGYNATISWHLNADPSPDFDYIPDVSNDPNWSEGSWYNKLVSGTSSVVALDDSWGATWVTPPSWTKVLQVGTTYYTRIFANGSHSYGPNIYVPVCAATNPPTWSGQLGTVAAGSTYSVTVSWTGGQMNPTFGYYIDISTDGSNWTGTQTWNTSHTYSGLVPGTNYYFRTYTANHSGTSGPLNVPVAGSPTCSGATPQGATVYSDSGVHRVYANGVSSDTTAMNFAFYPNNSGGTTWVAGTNTGGGQWYADANLAGFSPGTIQADTYMNSAYYENVGCGSAPFTIIPPLSANILANGSDGPITINYNGAANITWTSVSASSCSVSPTSWSGASNNGISTGNLISSTTYTLTCDGSAGGSVSDAVTVNVRPLPSKPNVTGLPSSAGPSGYTGFDISWSGDPGPGFYVDISDNSTFTRFWNKSVGAATTTTATDGFNGYQGVSGPLGNLQAGVTYYVRIYNGSPGYWSPVKDFVVSPAVQPTCTSATPDGAVAYSNTTQRVTANGVTNATDVLFPTWDIFNGQDDNDLVWYQGTNAGGGTWYRDINLASHNGNRDSTLITDVWMFTDVLDNVYCDGASYKKLGGTQLAISNPVTVSDDIKPVVENVSVIEPIYCVSGPAITTNWKYSDPLGSPQSAYQVQISRNDAFTQIDADSGKVINSGTSWFSGQGLLQFNTVYRARARAWNQNDIPSEWQLATTCNGSGCTGSSGNWKTPKYAYPQDGNPPFSWSPSNPSVNSPIQFTDNTVFDPASNNKQWSWTFVPAGGGSGSSAEQNPSYTFNDVGTYQVTLKVRDDAVPAGEFCTWPTAAINLQKPIPLWKEIAPR